MATKVSGDKFHVDTAAIRADGTIVSDAGVTLTGNISAVDVTASGDVSGVGGTFTGDIAGVNIAASGNLVTATQTPASAAAAGTAGTITWDGDYIDVCSESDTWLRAAIATW